jgi:hypothetical protein
MTIQDAWLLTRKILVGIAVTVIPLAILASGLWLTQTYSGNHTQSKQNPPKVTYAN